MFKVKVKILEGSLYPVDIELWEHNRVKYSLPYLSEKGAEELYEKLGQALQELELRKKAFDKEVSL